MDKSKTMADNYDAYYYANCCGVPYDEEHLWAFFGHIADRIVSDIAPKTVLDAGCAKGFCVQALRQHGVEAWGIDVSGHAISEVSPEAQPYCRVGSISEPFDREYDLIICQEVLEHMPQDEACWAIENICSHTEDVIFSSSPTDFTEPTHLNVQPPEFWALQFARLGFYRDVEFDASFIISHAARFRKMKDPAWQIVGAYERRLWQLTQEFCGMRTSLLTHQNQLAEKDGAVAQSQQELQALGAQKDGQAQQFQGELQRIAAEKEQAVAQLQQELQTLGAQKDSQTQQFQGELQRIAAEKEQAVAQLQQELQALGAQKDVQIQQLQEELQRIAAEKEQAVTQLQQELQALGAQKDGLAQQLQDELQRIAVEKEQAVAQLQQELKVLGAQTDSQIQQLQDELRGMVAEKEARITSRLLRWLRKDAENPAK